jgi:hypothetical protein
LITPKNGMLSAGVHHLVDKKQTNTGSLGYGVLGGSYDEVAIDPFGGRV